MFHRNIRLIHPTTRDHVAEDLKLPHQELTIFLPLVHVVIDLVTLCHGQDARLVLAYLVTAYRFRSFDKMNVE